MLVDMAGRKYELPRRKFAIAPAVVNLITGKFNHW